MLCDVAPSWGLRNVPNVFVYMYFYMRNNAQARPERTPRLQRMVLSKFVTSKIFCPVADSLQNPYWSFVKLIQSREQLSGVEKKSRRSDWSFGKLINSSFHENDENFQVPGIHSDYSKKRKGRQVLLSCGEVWSVWRCPTEKKLWDRSFMLICTAYLGDQASLVAELVTLTQSCQAWLVQVVDYRGTRNVGSSLPSWSMVRPEAQSVEVMDCSLRP